MKAEQRKRLEDVKVRAETLQNACAKAQGAITRAEESGSDEEAEGFIQAAERETAAILKRKRTKR